MTKFDIHQHVTNRILEALENGTAPWIKPWNSKGCTGELPYNIISKRKYQGLINVLLLWIENYPSPIWGTFKQFKEKGLSVKKGEKATQIVWASKVSKKINKQNPLTGEIENKENVFYTHKYYSVFNLCQTDYQFEEEENIEDQGENNIKAEEFINNIPIEKRYGGNSAFYDKINDYINVPPKSVFKTISDFFATLLHECIHATGHPSRLDRDLKGSFGTEKYAFEELVAELGSAFLCAELGVQGILQHENYIGSWIKSLKGDKKYIFKASTLASQSTDFLNKCQPNYKKEEGEVA